MDHPLTMSPLFVTIGSTTTIGLRCKAESINCEFYRVLHSLANTNNVFSYKQFTATVKAPESNYTDPVPLHFVHHRSARKDAIPLLFLHGWPGSSLEVGRIITNLTHPPNTSVPALHVVAPSSPASASPRPASNRASAPTRWATLLTR